MNDFDEELSLAFASFDRNHRDSALAHFEAAEALGSDKAAAMLGWIHETGWGGVDRSTLAAEKHYRCAISLGSSEASCYLGKLLVAQRRTEEGIALIAEAAVLGEPTAALYFGRDPTLALEKRIAWLEHGVKVRNVYCLVLSGRLLWRTGQLKEMIRGTFRMATGLASALRGLAHQKVSDLHEDVRFRS